MDRDRDFAIGALGLASAGLTTLDPQQLDLKMPLREGAVVRMDCACGVMADLNEEQMKKLGVDVPAEGCAGRYIVSKACPFCADTQVLVQPEFLPIP